MGDTNIDFYKGKASRTRLRKLGSFYATLSQPWFQFIDDIVTIKIQVQAMLPIYNVNSLMKVTSISDAVTTMKSGA